MPQDFPQPPPRSGKERDVYATQVGDDFNDLFEQNTQSGGRGFTTPLTGGDDSPVKKVPDSAPGGRQPQGYNQARGGGEWQDSDYNGYPWQMGSGDESAGIGVDGTRGDQRTTFGGTVRGGRETREFTGSDGHNVTGWPILTDSEDVVYDDDLVDEEEENGRQSGIGMRVVLGAAVFAGLIGGAYFFLGDLISKRKGQADEPLSAIGSSSPAPSPTLSPVGSVTEATPAAVTGSSARDQLAAPDGVGLSGQGRQSVPVDIPPVAGRSTTFDPPSGTLPVTTSGPTVVPVRPTSPDFPTSGSWTLQVASYSDQGQAEARLASLKAANLPARMLKAEIPGKGTWYRIQIGGFGSREEAISNGGQLRARGVIQDFIATPK